MAKQIDFVAQRHAAAKRVDNLQEAVDETQHLFEQAVKNKMVKASERLKATLKRQQTALAHAKAELQEWENAK